MNDLEGLPRQPLHTKIGTTKMTGSIKVVSLKERMLRKTVWHKANVDSDDVHRWGPRLWLPTYDLLAIALGISAYFFGSTLMNRLFPAPVVQAFGLAISLFALLCLIGVIFPKFNLGELIGKLGLVFMLGAYAGTVAFLSHNERNEFIVILLIMSVWLLLPRITVLFAQVAQKMDERKVRRLERKSA